MARPKKRCPGCHISNLPMTAHHVFPRNLFGRKGNNIVFLLCRRCHSELHKRIPQNDRKTREWYYQVLLDFLSDTEPHT